MEEFKDEKNDTIERNERNRTRVSFNEKEIERIMIEGFIFYKNEENKFFCTCCGKEWNTLCEALRHMETYILSGLKKEENRKKIGEIIKKEMEEEGYEFHEIKENKMEEIQNETINFENVMEKLNLANEIYKNNDFSGNVYYDYNTLLFDKKYHKIISS